MNSLLNNLMIDYEYDLIKVHHHIQKNIFIFPFKKQHYHSTVLECLINLCSKLKYDENENLNSLDQFKIIFYNER